LSAVGSGLALAGCAAAAGVVAERMLFAAPRYRGPVSDHFDGEHFHNADPSWQSEGSFLKWQLNRDLGVWPEWIESELGEAPPARVGNGRMRVTWVNHATLLLQVENVNILTDPIWSERCSPLSFVGPRRHRAPGIRFRDLPPIDVVLVSHNHYDHFDVATLHRLRWRFAPTMVTALGNGLLWGWAGIAAGRRSGGSGGSLPGWGSFAALRPSGASPAQDDRGLSGDGSFAALRGSAAAPAQDDSGARAAGRGPSHAIELDWWQSVRVAEHVEITCVPSQHFCARALSDRNRALWGGFVISTRSGNAYFAGDTGWGSHFGQIAERFGSIRLAMLPIGAYLPRWFMKMAHIEPAEAVEAHKVLGASVSVPMHYGTFRLGDDGEQRPLDDLRCAIDAGGTSSFEIIRHGEGFEA
jgi:L-ascorbate metabolism protein UlaG (beta-lactamase superfamily)